MFYLTDDEIADICKPLTQPAAQVRYLQSIGLLVKQKPNGRPLVSRANFDLVLGGMAGSVETTTNADEQPNESALILHFNKLKKHGKKTERQPPQAA